MGTHVPTKENAETNQNPERQRRANPSRQRRRPDSVVHPIVRGALPNRPVVNKAARRIRMSPVLPLSPLPSNLSLSLNNLRSQFSA